MVLLSRSSWMSMWSWLIQGFYLDAAAGGALWRLRAKYRSLKLDRLCRGLVLGKTLSARSPEARWSSSRSLVLRPETASSEDQQEESLVASQDPWSRQKAWAQRPLSFILIESDAGQDMRPLLVTPRILGNGAADPNPLMVSVCKSLWTDLTVISRTLSIGLVRPSLLKAWSADRDSPMALVLKGSSTGWTAISRTFWVPLVRLSHGIWTQELDWEVVLISKGSSPGWMVNCRTFWLPLIRPLLSGIVGSGLDAPVALVWKGSSTGSMIDADPSMALFCKYWSTAGWTLINRTSWVLLFRHYFVRRYRCIRSAYPSCLDLQSIDHQVVGQWFVAHSQTP